MGRLDRHPIQRRSLAGRRPAAALSSRALSVVLLAFGLLSVSGCATYSDRMVSTRQAASRGDYAGGIEEINDIIGTESSGELPIEWESDSALGVLERATLQQAASDYAASARDFEAADKQLELLDLSGDAVGTLGKYIYSDTAGNYRSSATEKLALNAFNTLNYLARGDLRGARVEAKRFTVMQNYLRELDPDRAHAAFGSYLAGFTLERLGEHTSAMRYYDEALQERQFGSLRGPVARLSRLTSYRGKRINAFLAAGTGSLRSGAKSPSKGAELLVVVSVGRVPYKTPERIPVGTAIGMAGSWITGDPTILAYSATKIVVYPELVDSVAVGDEAGLRVDGEPAELELASDLGGEIRREYDAIKAKIIGAALSRMIVRAAAAEGARAAVEKGGDASPLLGFVAAIATESALVAMDRPDTRSWQLLPQRVYVHRRSIRPGKHTVELSLGSAGQPPHRRELDVPPGGYAAVIVTSPR